MASSEGSGGTTNGAVSVMKREGKQGGRALSGKVADVSLSAPSGSAPLGSAWEHAAAEVGLPVKLAPRDLRHLKALDAAVRARGRDLRSELPGVMDRWRTVRGPYTDPMPWAVRRKLDAILPVSDTENAPETAPEIEGGVDVVGSPAWIEANNAKHARALAKLNAGGKKGGGS